MWLCTCDCGNVNLYIASRVRHKRVNMCRPCAVKLTASKIKIHGLRKTAEYQIWSGIKSRCYNTNAPDYERYGGRGITMHKKWVNSFEEFFSYVGKRPSKEYSIDRIDNDKGYEPNNIKWATKKEQARNHRNSVYVTDGKRVIHIVDAAEEIGISKGAAHLRLKRNKLNGFTKYT